MSTNAPKRILRWVLIVGIWIQDSIKHAWRIIAIMKFPCWPVLSLGFILLACRSNAPTVIRIMDGEQTYSIESAERVPLALLTKAGIVPQPYDGVLVNGIFQPIDRPLPETDSIQLQLRRAVPLTINSPQGQQVVQATAFTVGQALSEAGYPFYLSDLVQPPANTRIAGPMTITVAQARDMSIFTAENVIKVRSSAATVGELLAEAGVPLAGLDTSSPPENEAPPPDGQIRVVRVHESVTVTLAPIPFTTEVIESAEVPLGQQETIQPGVNGLAMRRTRIRFEDGKEVSRDKEEETVVRAPQTRIVAGGSQVVLAPVPISGVPNDYWLALEMYATVYSPCQSGTGGCSDRKSVV